MTETAGRLFIASPAYSSSFCAQYVESLVGTIKDCSKNGIPTLYKQLNGMHWIDIARDVLAHIFLHTDCTHMLQIDSDLGWSPDAPRRMIAKNLPIIGGVYPYRSDANMFVATGNGLPGGFLMVRRDVVERMSAGLTKYRCVSAEYGALEVAPLFTRIMRDYGYTGEDYAFCQRAKAHGFDLSIEPDIEFAHVGQKAWVGNFSKCQSI